jgi:hypothetical protein
VRELILIGISLGMLAACGSGAESTSATLVLSKAGRAEALVRSVDYGSGEMKHVDLRFVDGVALQTSDGPAALLTTSPMDACLRLAGLARTDGRFHVLSHAGSPVLVISRNERYPQGSVQLIERGLTMHVADGLPTLQTDGKRLVAKGRLDDPNPMTEALEYNVDLAFASLAAFDPLEADAGAEAQWLRGLMQSTRADAEAMATATFLEYEDDPNYDFRGSRATWSNLLQWPNFNVVAATSGPDCLTLVMQAPGHVVGSRKAIVRAVGAGDDRKVFAAETSEDRAIDVSYFVGRIEHPSLGAFPIVDARAETDANGRGVLIFSDGAIGEATWEQLVQKQRAVRAQAGDRFGTNYMLRTMEFAGPGMDAETIRAKNITNANISRVSIAGLINQGEAGEPRIVANFRLPLGAQASIAP